MNRFYRALRPHLTLFILLTVSLLPLVSFFITKDNPHTHDGFVHLVRIGAYFKALRDGQILPRWAGDLNYGYGMPLFNFIYQLPYLIASGFVALGSSLVQSFKLTIAISYLLGALGIYLFAKNLFKDEKTILIVGLMYQFAPFRLVELLVRGSFGELFTYAFFPFVLYGLTKLFKNPNFFDAALTALGTALLVLSHNSISLVFFTVAAAYIVFFAGSLRNFIFATSALLWGLMISSFYWIPALVERKYTYGDLFMKDLYKTHFPPVFQLFLPNFTNNPSLQTGGVAVQVGLFHVAAIFLGVLYLFRKKQEPIVTKLVLFSLLVSAVSLFFMLPQSIFLWERLAILRQFQFPWRLLAPVTFASAVLGMLYTQFVFLKKALIFTIFAMLIIMSTVYYWHPSLGYDHVSDESVYWNYPLDTTYFGETNVIWSAGSATSFPAARVQTIEGNATISGLVLQETVHTFRAQSTQSAKLVDNTQYFPGWNVYVDDGKVPVQFQDPNWRGLITFRVPAGTHAIRVVFEDTKIRAITKLISTGAFLCLIIAGFFSWRNKNV